LRADPGDPSVKSLSIELDCHPSTVYRLKNEGEIAFYRLGPNGDLRAFRQSVDAFKARYRDAYREPPVTRVA
jgi:hypothetical protein